MTRSSFIILLLSLIAISCGSFKKSDSCRQKQAVVEYGTSRVKMFIAEKNICEKQDIKTLGKTEWEIETYREADKMPNGMVAFHPSVVESLKKISQDISRVTKSFKVEKTFGIATGVYRSLDKRELIFADLEKIIGGSIKVLTPDEEAKMGLISIIATEKPTSNFIVWDFGGNSMQFSIVNNGNTSMVIGLPGSNGIRMEVMKKLNKKKTPNPIGAKNVAPVEKHLSSLLSSNLEALKSFQNFQVYGIGGVHAKSVGSALMHLMNEPEARVMYSQEQVGRLLAKLVTMNDSQIGGKFAQDQASNVLAVNMIMKQMGWKTVKVSEQTLALGYLLSL